MDPLTHALAGAAAARVVAARPLAGAALLPGALAALLPDLDALIRSSADPLLYAEFHRHFTHALAFVPIGGAVAAAPWLMARRYHARRGAYLAAATAGYATHGVLDASTTYGTLLLWPFSTTRISWDIVPIVDPLLTLALLLMVGLAWRRRRAWPAAAALLAGGLYLALGAAQRDRAMEAQATIAAMRGHEVRRGAVFPGFGSNLLWRSLYLDDEGRLHMDRLRVAWTGGISWRAGTDVDLLTFDELPADVRLDPRLQRDFWRFWWFTDGWVARSAIDPAVVGDARYSESATRFEAVWGIRFRPQDDPPIAWIDRSRERRIDAHALWMELRGADPRYRAIRHVRPPDAARPPEASRP